MMRTIKSKKTGKFISVAEPKFKKGQIVKRIDNLASDFTMIYSCEDPNYCETANSWMYGQEYIGRGGVRGGYSFSWK